MTSAKLRPFHDRLNLAEQVARIERNQAEIEKLFAEQGKLRAEGRKFNRDPWFIVLGAILAAVVTRLPEILAAFGLHH